MTPELLHRRLADSANMLVWMTDVDDVCIYLNQSTLVGAEQWAQINISAWAQFIHPDDRARFGTVMDACQLLRDAACDGAQGFLFSRPLALPEFESYLAHLPRTEAKQTDLS